MTKKLNHLDLANYVVGWLVHGDPVTVDGARQALQIALNQLDDYQDGILAVVERDPKHGCLTQQPELEWEALTYEGVAHVYRSSAVLIGGCWDITPDLTPGSERVLLRNPYTSHPDWEYHFFEGPDALEQAKAYARAYPEEDGAPL